MALSTISAIERARANGHLVVLCTGRTKPEIPYEIWEFGFDGAIMAGGAHLEVRNALLAQHAFPQAILTAMTKRFKTFGWDYVLYSTDGVHPSERMRQRFREIAVNAFGNGLPSAPNGSIQISPLKHPLLGANWESTENKGNSLIKALFLSNSSFERELFEQQFTATIQVVPASIAALPPGSGEVTAFGVNKGSAVRGMMDYFGCHTEQAIGIGDSYNDLEMFHACGTAISVSSAPSHVREISDFTTGPPLDDGIYNALKHCGLMS